jgi:hypothetical protein
VTFLAETVQVDSLSVSLAIVVGSAAVLLGGAFGVGAIVTQLRAAVVQLEKLSAKLDLVDARVLKIETRLESEAKEQHR